MAPANSDCNAMVKACIAMVQDATDVSRIGHSGLDYPVQREWEFHEAVKRFGLDEGESLFRLTGSQKQLIHATEFSPSSSLRSVSIQEVMERQAERRKVGHTDGGVSNLHAL